MKKFEFFASIFFFIVGIAILAIIMPIVNFTIFGNILGYAIGALFVWAGVKAMKESFQKDPQTQN